MGRIVAPDDRWRDSVIALDACTRRIRPRVGKRIT
jgi:hypothetical protein